jgi:hypothetical protein
MQEAGRNIWRRQTPYYFAFLEFCQFKEVGHSLRAHGYVRRNTSMEPSSWDANIPSASQEFPRILWNPTIRYHVYHSSPSVPILSPINSVHPPNRFLEDLFFFLILCSHLCWGLPSGHLPPQPLVAYWMQKWHYPKIAHLELILQLS